MQIEFHLLGEDRIHWNTVDYLRGYVPHVASRPSIDVVDDNFLQVGGVRSGLNTLSLGMEAFGGARIERVIVFPDTSLTRTPAGPARVAITAPRNTVSARVNLPTAVPFLVRGVGERAPLNVQVGLRIRDTSNLKVVGATHFRYPRVDGPISGRFLVRARKQGTYTLRLVGVNVSSTASRPVTLRVTARSGFPVSAVIAVGAAGAIALLVVGFAISRRR